MGEESQRVVDLLLARFVLAAALGSDGDKLGVERIGDVDSDGAHRLVFEWLPIEGHERVELLAAGVLSAEFCLTFKVLGEFGLEGLGVNFFFAFTAFHICLVF
jgi:hypothetical protein